MSTYHGGRLIVSSSADSEATVAEEAQTDETSQLRHKIEKLEGQAMTKRLELEKMRDLVDESGKNAYYRLAAQIETFKRTSAGTAERSTERTKATVCRALMPVLAAFEDIDDEGETKISSNYQQVYASLVEALTQIGLEQYHAIPGEGFNPLLHEADVTTGIVLREIKNGFRLLSTGDIIRPAKCEVEPAPSDENAPDPPLDQEREGEQ